MPIVLKRNIEPEGIVAVWEILEPERYFEELLELDPAEQAYTESFKGRRKIEWLASRLLLHQLSERNERGRLYKDEFGKPHLENSQYHVSLSHSHNLVAVIASPTKVGVDIQYHVDKIERIAHKFVGDHEGKYLEASKFYLEELHIIWGAKECLYKAYGRKRVDFKSHLFVDTFRFDGRNGSSVQASFIKGDIVEKYDVYYESFNNYYLVYALQK